MHIFETSRGLQELQAGRLPEAAAALEGRFSVDEADRVLGVIDAANVAALGRIRIHTGDQRAADDVARICEVVLETSAPSGRRHAAWFLARHAMARLRRLGVRRRVQPPQAPSTGWAALTRAELEVARLVAQGKTNREIADHLFVSPHTVNTHLRHIFAKMGVKSRVQLASVASERSE